MPPTQSPARKAAVLTAATAALRAAEAVPVTVTFSMSADDAFEQGQGASATQRDAATGNIILYDRQLIEDDGPGVGYDQPGKNAGVPPIELSGSARVRKILHVEHPEASAAHLIVPRGAAVTINGQPLEISPGETSSEIPVSLLKKGDNELILSAPDRGLKIKTASRGDLLRNAPERAGSPPRTFTSDDHGQTWRPYDGEAMVRLHLLQYAGEGSFISPVLDLAKTDADSAPLLSGALSVQSITLESESQTPAGTSIQFLVRSGSTPVQDPAHWSDWRPADAETPASHRYLQWKAILKSQNPLVTPALKQVTVQAKVLRQKPPAWATALKIAAANNPEIRYTSIPFAYEDPNHPRLVALRKKYKLDEIVAEAPTEFEKFTRLRNWVSAQWKWTPPIENYPDWDADEILTRKYGFCVQHAIVYMQCALALGYQTRFLFSNNPGNGGHEVCETWSNEYQKWVYIDCADNLHYVDPKTNIPMSMLETHDLEMKVYFPEPGQMVTGENLPDEKKLTPDLGICYVLETHPTGKSPKWSREQVVDGVYPLNRLWTVVRYMPRNNYYSQPDPRPICQGRHWDYSDYIVWRGPKMATAQWLYRNFTSRRSDLDWTLNQTRFEATPAGTPGTLHMQFGTVTPWLETFLVKTDRGDWQPTGAGFDWRLHSGINRLEMRTRTTSGILGPVSFLEVDSPP